MTPELKKCVEVLQEIVDYLIPKLALTGGYNRKYEALTTAIRYIEEHEAEIAQVIEDTIKLSEEEIDRLKAELKKAQARVMGVEEIREKLDNSFDYGVNFQCTKEGREYANRKLDELAQALHSKLYGGKDG